MARSVIVHPRVHDRHPDIDEDDVKVAWMGAIVSTLRLGKNPSEYVALGFDAKGRLLELVAVRTNNADWVVFHAMTPPSEETFRELGIERRSK